MAERWLDPSENGGLRLSFQLHRRAQLSSASGDTTSAESCWVTLARRGSPWRWDATRALEDLALARGDTAPIDSFLRTVPDTRGFRGPAVAEQLGLLRGRMQLARRDSFAAASTLEGVVGVNTPEGMEAFALLQPLRRVLPDSVEIVAFESAIASVEFARGQQDQAIRRLRSVFWPAAHRRDRGPNPFLLLGNDLASRLQRLRRYPEALAIYDTLERSSPDSVFRARVVMDRARALRDAGLTDSAFAEYRRAAALATREYGSTAWWEIGREAEEQGRFADARDAYARIEPARAARIRLGLIALAAGDRLQARSWFARDTSDAARFWWAISSRDSARSAADSVLGILAHRPGYDFYRTCARESLGLHISQVRAAGNPRDADSDPTIALARNLVRAGLTDDAASVIDRFGDVDLEAGGRPVNMLVATRSTLEAIALANASGRYRLALRMASRNLELRSTESDKRTLYNAVPGLEEEFDQARRDSLVVGVSDIIPYLYPPHYSGLIDSLARDRRIGIERALLQALVWQESRFDSGAVSRAGAVGLTQLTPITVGTVAQRLRERTPPTEALTGARLNLRYGATHLKQLLDRFQGRVPLALAAYNAGIPAAERWAKLAPGGGDALLCEMMAYTETREYVKNILAARQAYRDLKPYPIRP